MIEYLVRIYYYRGIYLQRKEVGATIAPMLLEFHYADTTIYQVDFLNLHIIKKMMGICSGLQQALITRINFIHRQRHYFTSRPQSTPPRTQQASLLRAYIKKHK